MSQKTDSRQGFTIVELLIAMAVFAIVLIIITTGILQVTRVYYKGLTETNTQNTARSIIDAISQAIQLSGGDVTSTPASDAAIPGASYAFCVGDQQFSYTLGYQLMDNPNSSQTYHALVVNDISGCAGATAQDVRSQAVQGRELMNPRMRLSDLTVQPSVSNPNLYQIHVRVVYGDDEVLTDPADATNTVCQNVRSGTQFCAISDLSTTVLKRVQ